MSVMVSTLSVALRDVLDTPNNFLSISNSMRCARARLSAHPVLSLRLHTELAREHPAGRRFFPMNVIPDALFGPLRIHKEEARRDGVGQRVVAPEEVEGARARGLLLLTLAGIEGG